MIIEEYLNRINYKGRKNLNLDVLKGLQESHLFHVPFENLDIQYGIPIDLDIPKIYKKVVLNRRGGFCYELNGLFYELLKYMGFETQLISARVFNSSKNDFGEEFDHLAILVHLNKTLYLVDVGFGSFTLFPLEFNLNTIQSDPEGKFIIEVYNAEYFKVSKIVDDEKIIEYIFSLKERGLHDFKKMCDYHQTSSDSHFTQKRLISKPTKSGRITISGNKLIVSENGSKVEQEFTNQEFGYHLLKWFQIDENQL